jgi:DNA repair protein RecO (recombination protein O)
LNNRRRPPAFLRQGSGGRNGWSDQDLQDSFQLKAAFS